MKTLLHRCRNWWRDERGVISIEAVVAFPMIIWAVMAMYIFFDAYKQKVISIKAANAIADVLSRQQEQEFKPFIDKLNTLYADLTYGRQDVKIRVTAVVYDDNDTPGIPEDDFHRRVWSEPSSDSGLTGLTQAEINSELSPDIPIMADGDTVIVVETWATYRPFSKFVKLPETVSLYEIAVVNPRDPQFKCLDCTS